MRLNIGAADRHVDGYLCVDIAPPPCEVCDAISRQEYRTHDLSRKWLVSTSSVEEVLAYDVIEHIEDRIHFMNEMHRVLVPGGRAIIETPNAAKGVGYIQDPTHRSEWCFSTFRYFDADAFAHNRKISEGVTLADVYGITAAFKVVSLTESRSNGEDPREEVWKIRAELVAVK